jgi:hypothetical protein
VGKVVEAAKVVVAMELPVLPDWPQSQQLANSYALLAGRCCVKPCAEYAL